MSVCGTETEKARADGGNGNARNQQHANKYGCHFSPKRNDLCLYRIFVSQSFPLFVHVFFRQSGIVLAGTGGTFRLGEQGIQLPTFLVFQQLLPLLMSIFMGVFHHLKQKFSLFHFYLFLVVHVTVSLHDANVYRRQSRLCPSFGQSL